MKRSHVVFPGTFDPPTRGHLDIAERALGLFDSLTVAVARGGRSTLLPADRRADLFRACLAELPGGERAEVAVFDGLLVDFVRSAGACAVVRGVRGAVDLDHELPMAAANSALWAGFELVLLPARPGLAMVSGTIVRDIARLGGDLDPFVPPRVAAALADVGKDDA